MSSHRAKVIVQTQESLLIDLGPGGSDYTDGGTRIAFRS